ncbi:hypothetical protein [Glycomyces sp. NRRL B-16210]|uniref:hypothetical protein n=1 Tax=Glycomyces sp. NRRL B-16210 TaxID=1463821 RepID=UPI0004BE6E32|nr:hypothetical protein [Glycomyces sp. NRRL B-16210]
MTQWNRSIGAVALAAALAASAACTASDEDGTEGSGAGTSQEQTETDLLGLLNESGRLVRELVAAENRILTQCLEDRGFTVHDRFTIMEIGGYEADSLAIGDPIEGLFPEPDIAAKWGFGAWADTAEGMEAPDYDEYRESRRSGDSEGFDGSPESGGPMGDSDPIDNSAFDALSPDDRLAWYIAYGGEEYAVWQGLADEELEAQYRDEDGIRTTPAPGGCYLEMVESLYGEPELVIDEETGSSRWTGRPSSPEFEGEGWAQVVPTYRERVADEESAFVDCLIDRGRGEWEFSELGDLSIWAYFTGVYSGQWTSSDGADYTEGVPAPPSDLPSDFEGLRQYETGVAVDFVECGDESGLRETSPAQWEAVHLEYYQSIEPELYAWQEQIREALAKSQELIGSLRSGALSARHLRGARSLYR